MDNLRIKLGKRVIAYTDIKAHPEQFHNDFETAKRTERPKCLCVGNTPELYIAKRAYYYLAKMPGTGHHHHPDCPFYETVVADSGRSGYEGAFVEDDGNVSVKLAFSLVKHRSPKARALATEPSEKPKTKVRNATGLLGLLHFLWERSKNNMWFPVVQGKEVQSRNWRQVAYHLNRAVATMRSGKRPLADSLYIVPAFDTRQAVALGAAWSAAMEDVVRSGSEDAARSNAPQNFKLLIAELGSVSQTAHGYAMIFRQTGNRVFLSNDGHAKMLRSYAGAVSSLGEPNSRSVAIVLVGASQKGYFTAVDVALMRTNAAYVPIDSSYEITVADRLIESKRRFEKPLRYDCAELTLPDFILLDADVPRIPMEVYGMTGHPDYDRRHKQKQEQYQSSGRPVWEWEPANQKDLPIFPPPRSPE